MARLFALREGTTEDYIPVKCTADGELYISDRGATTSAKAVSGNTNATPDTSDAVAFGVTSRAIYVKNTDPVDTMQVSFDGGTTWFTLTAGDAVSLDLVRTGVHVKAAVASVAYAMLVSG